MLYAVESGRPSITAISLPLTLLVGWYGMNLKIPEFKWDVGYPMVTILTVGFLRSAW